MAAGTICDVARSFSSMLALGLCRFVFMAAIASIGDVIVWMADPAGDVCLISVIQGKGVIAQVGGQPSRGCVADLAIDAKTSSVKLGFRVAGDTSGREFVKRLPRVTALARQCGMGPVQRKQGLVVERSHGLASLVARKTV